MGKFYEVSLDSEYFNDLIYNLGGKYDKGFNTQKEAITYARSIKNELKELFKDYKNSYNTITLDITKYNIYEDENKLTTLDPVEIVYSLNIIGRY